MWKTRRSPAAVRAAASRDPGPVRLNLPVCAAARDGQCVVLAADLADKAAGRGGISLDGLDAALDSRNPVMSLTVVFRQTALLHLRAEHHAVRCHTLLGEFAAAAGQ